MKFEGLISLIDLQLYATAELVVFIVTIVTIRALERKNWELGYI